MGQLEPRRVRGVDRVSIVVKYMGLRVRRKKNRGALCSPGRCSGEFFAPPGVVLLRGNRKMGKNGKDFAKWYGTLKHMENGCKQPS